jgi:hypothetical protein
MSEDQKNKEKLEEVGKVLEENMDGGILLPEFMSLIHEHDLTLSILQSEKYGVVLLLDVNKEVWGFKLKSKTSILPGSSIKNAMVQITNIKGAIDFLSENKNRVVIRSFDRSDGKGKCYRYYLKKLKNTK